MAEDDFTPPSPYERVEQPFTPPPPESRVTDVGGGPGVALAVPEGAPGYDPAAAGVAERAAGITFPRSEEAGPIVPIPKIPQQQSALAQVGAGLVNVAGSSVEALETPQNLAVLPLAAVRGGARLTQLLFGAGALKGAYESGKEAFDPNKTLQERIQAGGQSVVDLAFGGVMLHGAARGLRLSDTLKPILGEREIGPTAATESEVIKDASEIPGTARTTQPEIRPQVGEETPLRQQGEVTQARQGSEAQPEKVEAFPSISQSAEDARRAQPVSTEGQASVVSEQPKTEGGVSEEVQKGQGEGEKILEPSAAVSGTERPPAASPPGIIGTAVKSGDQIIQGDRFNESHDSIGTRNNIDVSEESRGFMVQDADGTQRFVGREEAGQIAKQSGQVPATFEGPLHSESLIEAPKGESGRTIPEQAEPIRVRAMTALKSVYDAAQKAGTAGYKRGLSEARAEGQSAVAQIKGELSVADKWLSGDQEKVRQNMVEFVNKSLPPEERGRFVGAITRALRRPPIQGGDPAIMYRHAFNVFKLIQGRAEGVYKEGLISDIKGTLSKSIQSKSVDVQYRRGLQGVLDKISLTKPSEQTLGRLKSLQEFVEKERAAGREPNIPKEHLDQLSTLEKLPLRDMTTNSLEQLRDNVENLTSLGKLKSNLMQRSWAKSRENAIKELRQTPSNPIETRPMYRPQPTERLTVGQKFMNVVRGTLNARLNLENAIAPMDEIYDHLDGARGTYDGWASRNIKGRLDLDRNKTVSEWLPIKKQSDAIISKYGLKGADFETIQAKGIIKMIGSERLEAMGVRPDIIDRIDKTPFTKGQQEYHDFIRNQYGQTGTRIRDVAHRLYQQDMQVVPDYMPLERDWAAHSEREPPAPMADPSVGEMPFNETATMNQLLRDVNPKILSRTEQGFLKERMEGAKTAVKLDANQVFERHMQDALHFVNSQGNLKLLGEIVRRPEFAKKFGKTGQNIVLDHLDTVANQGYVNHSQRIRWLDWVRNSTSKGAIGFRVASNFVHTSQLPIAMYHAGGAQWWSKGLELALSEKGQNWLRQNAAETYVRSGGEPAQAEVEAFSKFGRAGFFVARNIDKLNSQATLLGRYAKEMNKAGTPLDHVLDAPVNPDLQGLALRRMHRAVASPQAKDIPQMTSRGAFVGGNVSVARAINQFRNIFLDNWSNVRHDVLRVGISDGDKIVNNLRQGEIAAGARQVGDAASHRAAIAAAMLMSVAMETGIKLASKKGIEKGMSAITGVQPPERKEKETYIGDLQHHMINRIPFAGQLYTTAVYGETGIPTIDAMLAPLIETGKVLKSKKPETQAKHVVRAASALGTVAGISGTSQVLEAAQPVITKKLAEIIPDRSKGRESGSQTYTK